LSYGGVSFVTGALGSITLVGSRSLLVRYFGADSNGYYQVVFLLSASYLPFFTNGLWSYFYPKISALTDRDRYSVEVNHAIRLCAFGIVPLVAAVYIFRKSIIYTVFTGKFVPAETLFSAQLGGDVFFLLYYVMATSLLAGGRLKAYLVSGAVYAILFIGLFMAFKFKLGVNAITVSYLVSNALLFIASVIYHVYYMGIKIYKRNVNLLLSASAVCGIILFLGSGSIIQTVFKSVILILWLYFLPTDLERRKAASFISNKIRGIYGFSG
jgi:PST family polysaccharide transporter